MLAPPPQWLLVLTPPPTPLRPAFVPTSHSERDDEGDGEGDGEADADPDAEAGADDACSAVGVAFIAAGPAAEDGDEGLDITTWCSCGSGAAFVAWPIHCPCAGTGPVPGIAELSGIVSSPAATAAAAAAVVVMTPPVARGNATDIGEDTVGIVSVLDGNADADGAVARVCCS